MSPFLFLIPLYSAFVNKTCTFLNGFLWGVIFWFIHSAGLFCVVYYEGVGSLRIVFPLLFVVYCSLYSGVWFWGLHKTASRNKADWYFVSITVFYFWFVDTLILSPFGKIQGYPLAFPLIPIMQLPQLLWSVSYVGKWVAFLFLIILQMGLVKGWVKRHYWFVAFLINTIFTSGFFLLPNISIPDWVNRIQFIPLNESVHPHERAQELVAQLVQQKSTKLFVFPESYFPFSINEQSNSLKILQNYLLQEKQYAFFGANQKINNNLYNAAFLIDQCRIIQSYEKSHLIPFFECNPYKMNQIGLFFNFFPHKGNTFYRANRTLSVFKLPYLPPFIPLICSELFWLEQVPDTLPGVLLCLAKDAYFKKSGYKQIMLFSAQFTALTHQRYLAYCASNSAYLIDNFGRKVYDF